MEKIKGFLGKLSDKAKKIIIASVVGVAVVAGAIIMALSMNPIVSCIFSPKRMRSLIRR